jgi:smad nuclear-interacting protein 1
MSERELPNYDVSGLLEKDLHMVNGVYVKWLEPCNLIPFGALSKCIAGRQCKLFVFKDSKPVGGTEGRWDLTKSSAFLFGRDRASRAVDIPLDHPSSSGQHAVVCHCATGGGEAAPFIVDLASTNGTFLNGRRLRPFEYSELHHQDVIRFGLSTREWVLVMPPES